jgi:hypothetical protein
VAHAAGQRGPPPPGCGDRPEREVDVTDKKAKVPKKAKAVKPKAAKA